jgi:hypothetical protein
MEILQCRRQCLRVCEVDADSGYVRLAELLKKLDLVLGRAGRRVLIADLDVIELWSVTFGTGPENGPKRVRFPGADEKDHVPLCPCGDAGGSAIARQAAVIAA